MKTTIVSTIFLVFSLSLMGQVKRHNPALEAKNEGGVLLLNFSYGGHLPGADMATRFGSNFLAGLNVDYFTPNNWVFGLQGDFLFGREVKTDVLQNLRGSEGFVYADDGGFADVQLRERGLVISGHVGKVIPISANNKRSGIRLSVGAGMMTHKIRIQDEPQVFVSALSDSYKKGYDRLANGFALTEFIGYQHIANNRLVNFSIGIELYQGFTKGRRNFNFDTQLPGLEKRLDLLYGYRLTWTLPLFIGENPDEINY